MHYEPTEEMKTRFESFLNEYPDWLRPTFQDEKTKTTALKIWWSAESGRLAEQKKITDFRLAFYRLTNIG